MLWPVGWRHTFPSRCQFAAAFKRPKLRVGRAALSRLPWSRSCRRAIKFAQVRISSHPSWQRLGAMSWATVVQRAPLTLLAAPTTAERPANDGGKGGGGSAGIDRQGSSVGRLAATGENGRSAKPLSALPACSSQRSLAALRMLAKAFQLHHTLKLFGAGFGRPRPTNRRPGRAPVPAITHRKPASSRCTRRRKTQRPTRRGRETA